MPGPYPPGPGVGPDGQPVNAHHEAPRAGPPASFPTPPRRSRRMVWLGVVVAMAAVASVSLAIVQASHRPSTSPAGVFTDANAKAAIQGYLDALQRRDTDAIARDALCGIYDAVRDRRSDQAVAKLSSDAFRKQFSAATVTGIDKVVYWSDYQAQVLFTMRVEPTSGAGATTEVQGIAQLLSQRGRILVCSYVLHSAGMY